MLLTPPLARGLLPGILRGGCSTRGGRGRPSSGRSDLADGFLIGNALRGLVRARLRSAGAEAAA